MKAEIEKMVKEYLEGTGYELQTLEIDGDNNILVEIDRLGVVDVDFCAELNRHLVEALDRLAVSGERLAENYSLEVGSVSLTAPFKSKIQYHKHLGHPVVVTAKDEAGVLKKYHGQLISVDEDTFSVELAGKGKKAGETKTWGYGEIEEIVYDLKI